MVSQAHKVRSDSLTPVSRLVYPSRRLRFHPHDRYDERAVKEKYPLFRVHSDRPSGPFVGINPGTSATVDITLRLFEQVWRLLHESGLVTKPISYEQDISLRNGAMDYKLVARASAASMISSPLV